LLRIDLARPHLFPPPRAGEDEGGGSRAKAWFDKLTTLSKVEEAKDAKINAWIIFDSE